MTTIGDSTPYCTVPLGLCTRFEPPTRLGFFEKCLMQGSFILNYQKRSFLLREKWRTRRRLSIMGCQDAVNAKWNLYNRHFCTFGLFRNKL